MYTKKGLKITQHQERDLPKSFKERHPQLVRSLKIFDLSMAEYSKAISSIYEPKTYTSSSTKIKYG